MKIMKSQRSISRVILFSAILVMVLLIISCSNNSLNEKEYMTYKDDLCYFKIKVPNTWQISKSDSDTSFMRVCFKSPDDKQDLCVFVIKARKKIDLSSFASNSDNFFNGLGENIPESKKIINYILHQFKIEKTYQNGNLVTKLLFKKDYHFGYIISYQCTDNNFHNYEIISKSFVSDVPFSKKASTWAKGLLGDFGEWIIGIIMGIVGIFVLIEIGLFGQLVRKGVKTKKALNKIRNESAQKGLEVNDKWHLYFKKSSRWILLPILGLVFVYIIVFLAFSLKIFLISLFGLIPFILGYYGILFVPSDEIEDYLE
jgi:hypothetical protein